MKLGKTLVFCAKQFENNTKYSYIKIGEVTAEKIKKLQFNQIGK